MGHPHARLGTLSVFGLDLRVGLGVDCAMTVSPVVNFDWSLGECILASVAPSWRMTIGADWAPIRRYADLIAEEPAGIYGDLLPLLAESDLNVFNVEAVLSDKALAPIPKAGPALIGDPRSTESLKAAHCHVACLANNHAMDFGAEGLRETLNALRAAGIATVGAELEEQAIGAPLIQTVQGVRVAIINCAEGESGRSQRGEPGVLGLDTGAEILRIQEMRRQNLADVVVVIFHGGREYVPVPPPYVVRELRQLAEAGADAVIAHHPHAPQGVEVHQGVPIVYSQGNFVFWQDRKVYASHVGYLAHLDFSGKSLHALRVSPYCVLPGGLRLMSPEEREVFTKKMTRASMPLRSQRDIEACWAAMADYQDYDEFCDYHLREFTQSRSGPNIPESAMKMQNHFLTPAHSALYHELLERHAKGLRGSAPAWAQALLREWLEEDAPGLV